MYKREEPGKDSWNVLGCGQWFFSLQLSVSAEAVHLRTLLNLCLTTSTALGTNSTSLYLFGRLGVFIIFWNCLIITPIPIASCPDAYGSHAPSFAARQDEI
jgi:hypothetical protein